MKRNHLYSFVKLDNPNLIWLFHTQLSFGGQACNLQLKAISLLVPCSHLEVLILGQDFTFLDPMQPTFNHSTFQVPKVKVFSLKKQQNGNARTGTQGKRAAGPYLPPMPGFPGSWVPGCQCLVEAKGWSLPLLKYSLPLSILFSYLLCFVLAAKSVSPAGHKKQSSVTIQKSQ